MPGLSGLVSYYIFLIMCEIIRNLAVLCAANLSLLSISIWIRLRLRSTDTRGRSQYGAYEHGSRAQAWKNADSSAHVFIYASK